MRFHEGYQLKNSKNNTFFLLSMCIKMPLKENYPFFKLSSIARIVSSACFLFIFT